MYTNHFVFASASSFCIVLQANLQQAECQALSAESMYDELQPMPSRGSINASLVDDAWQQRSTPETGGAWNAGRVARIFATLISGAYCGYSLYKYNLFVLRSGGYLPWWMYLITYLPAIIGTLVVFVPGCIMACSKACCCKPSIKSMGQVQLIGAVICLLYELYNMVCAAVLCAKQNRGFGPRPGGNHTPSACPDGFNSFYWSPGPPHYNSGIVNFPVSMLLMLCTCIAVFSK